MRKWMLSGFHPVLRCKESLLPRVAYMLSPSPAFSSPRATSGAGSYFESQVGTAFVVLMLADGVVPCLGMRGIRKIQFQSKDGPRTDDFVVFTGDVDSPVERKLLVNVKLRVSVSKGDSNFAKVINSAWHDFRNTSVFQRGTNSSSGDAFVMVTPAISQVDIDHTRELFELARYHPISDEFFTFVGRSKAVSNQQRQKLKVLRTVLDRANGGQAVTDVEFHDFLRHFHWLSFDFDLRQGLDRALLISLCAQTARKPPADVWQNILEEVQYANQNAGIIQPDTVSEENVHFYRMSMVRSIMGARRISMAL